MVGLCRTPPGNNTQAPFYHQTVSPRRLEANPLMKLFRLGGERTYRPVGTAQKKVSILLHSSGRVRYLPQNLFCFTGSLLDQSVGTQWNVLNWRLSQILRSSRCPFWAADGDAAELRQECLEATGCIPFVRRDCEIILNKNLHVQGKKLPKAVALGLTFGTLRTWVEP